MPVTIGNELESKVNELTRMLSTNLQDFKHNANVLANDLHVSVSDRELGDVHDKIAEMANSLNLASENMASALSTLNGTFTFHNVAYNNETESIRDTQINNVESDSGAETDYQIQQENNIPDTDSETDNELFYDSDKDKEQKKYDYLLNADGENIETKNKEQTTINNNINTYSGILGPFMFFTDAVFFFINSFIIFIKDIVMFFIEPFVFIINNIYEPCKSCLKKLLNSPKTLFTMFLFAFNPKYFFAALFLALKNFFNILKFCFKLIYFFVSDSRKIIKNFLFATKLFIMPFKMFYSFFYILTRTFLEFSKCFVTFWFKIIEKK